MAESRKKKTTPKKAVVHRKKKETAPAPSHVTAAAPVPAPVPRRPKAPKISGPKYFGTGRRKEAVARVWLTPGEGKITVNDQPFSAYFCGRKLLEYQASRPLVAAQVQGKYDVTAEAYGGGVPGQAVAVGLGIARALIQASPELKVILRREGCLTRDPRMKERKKYGLKRARRAFQYTKR